MIAFTDTSVIQQLNGAEKIWSPAVLLESCNPLEGEALDVRTQAMKQLLPIAEEVFGELSEAAKRCYYFWKQLVPQRIEERRYEYSVKISKTYRWVVTVNSDGLFYQDVDGMYNQPDGKVCEQLLSDFWFYGPLMPVPALDTRKWMVAQIRNAFLQIGPVAYQHFKLFDYPPLVIDGHWTEGDAAHFQHYVNLRPFGVEYGKTTWRDGLAYVGFLSFEHFLADPTALEHHITAGIRADISAHLSDQPGHDQTHRNSRDNAQEEERTEMKRMFMENGGMRHLIYREYGKAYHPSLLDEHAWRSELTEKQLLQLETEDRESVIRYLAAVLEYNGMEDMENRLVEIAKIATPKARQAIAGVLAEPYQSAKAAMVLLSLLEFEAQDTYWRDYVFNRFSRMRRDRVVQQFIRQCLEGDNETHFKKAVEVLQMWGYLGDVALAGRDLIAGLNWEDAVAGDPAFRHALAKVIRIIHT